MLDFSLLLARLGGHGQYEVLDVGSGQLFLALVDRRQLVSERLSILVRHAEGLDEAVFDFLEGELAIFLAAVERHKLVDNLFVAEVKLDYSRSLLRCKTHCEHGSGEGRQRKEFHAKFFFVNYE